MPSDPQARQVTFDQARPPALPSGDYTLTVTQTMDVTTPGDPASNAPPQTYHEVYQNTHTIAVQGPRTVLQASTIVARFPPANGSGDYDQVFPHLVLGQDSLPWQRSLVMKQKSGWNQVDVPPPPWFALLLLDAGTAPPITSGTLASVEHASAAPVPLPADTVSYGDQPGWTHEWGQASTDSCTFIDLPRTDFLALAPSPDDLPWLVHTRKVSLITPSLRDLAGEAPGSYAVVCSNRMARSGQAYRAVLVSLEGMADLLPIDGDTPGFNPAAWTPPSSTGLYSKVRLFVLDSWPFVAQAPAETFTGYLTHLNPAPLANRPVASGHLTGGTPEQQAAQDALTSAYQGGYSLLPHSTRTGEQTVSWYRGPLVPYAPVPMAQPDAMSTGPDSLVGYDPDQGLMDLSLATAWQTGQLLALQDATFAQALLAWRTERAQAGMQERWRRTLHAAVAPALTARRPAGTVEDGRAPPVLETPFHRSIEQALLATFDVLARSTP